MAYSSATGRSRQRRKARQRSARTIPIRSRCRSWETALSRLSHTYLTLSYIPSETLMAHHRYTTGIPTSILSSHHRTYRATILLAHLLRFSRTCKQDHNILRHHPHLQSSNRSKDPRRVNHLLQSHHPRRKPLVQLPDRHPPVLVVVRHSLRRRHLHRLRKRATLIR